MTYASLAEGFESGGFKISALTPPFLPATVWSYEVGLKAQTSDHRFSANVAAFLWLASPSGRALLPH